MKPPTILLIALTLSFGCSSGPKPVGQDLSAVRLEHFPKDKRIDVSVGIELFTSYLYSDTLEKPVLFPIVAAGGITVTRGYPIAPRSGESVDHPHHTGFWFNYGNVNGIDFWGNSKEIPAEKKSRYGVIRFRNIEKLVSLTEKGILEVNHDWVNPDGVISLGENVRFVFYATRDYRIIDRITTLTAQVPEVNFADTKEGAFAIRVARFLEFPSEVPRSFVDAYGKVTPIAVLNNEGVNGNYLSSEGVEGASVWSTRARWMKLSGVNRGDTVSIVFMDHSSNLNFPTFWHARDYGLFSANPLGQKDFTGGKESLNLTIKSGESLIFRHRLLIKSGNDCLSSEIGQYWNAFVKEYE